MFGFGNKNKKKQTETSLELITMEMAMRNISPDQFFGRKTASEFKAQEQAAVDQHKSHSTRETGQADKKKSFFSPKSESQKAQKQETKPKSSGPFLGSEDESFLPQDSINQRTIKPQKVELPLEKKVHKTKQDAGENKKRFSLEDILKESSPFQQKDLALDATSQEQIFSEKELAVPSRPKTAPTKRNLPAEKPVRQPKERLPKEKISQGKEQERQPLQKRELLIEKLLKNPYPAKAGSPCPFGGPPAQKEIQETKLSPANAESSAGTGNKKSKQAFSSQSKPILNELPKKEEPLQDSAIPLKSPHGTEKTSLSSELEKRKNEKKPENHENLASRGQIKLDSRIHPEKKYSRLLLFIAVFLLISTIISGAYYYFFIIKQTQSGWAPIKIPSAIEKGDTDESSQIDNEISTIAEFLDKTTSRSINEKTFQKDLQSLVIALRSDQESRKELERGMFLRPVSEDNKPYAPEKILSLLEVESNGIAQTLDENAWFFLAGENTSKTPHANFVVKVNLLMELKSELPGAQIVSIFMDFEEKMPEQFLPLFVDEEKPLVPRIISFKRSFTQNDIAPQTRYFNYQDGAASKSIDWSVISQADRSYLMISTSKDSTEKIMNALQHRQLP